MSFYLINPLNKYNILEAILFDKPLKYRQYTNGDFPHIKKLNFVGFLKYAFFLSLFVAISFKHMSVWTKFQSLKLQNTRLVLHVINKWHS